MLADDSYLQKLEDQLRNLKQQNTQLLNGFDEAWQGPAVGSSSDAAFASASSASRHIAAPVVGSAALPTQAPLPSNGTEAACKMKYHADMLLHHLVQASSSTQSYAVDPHVEPPQQEVPKAATPSHTHGQSERPRASRPQHGHTWASSRVTKTKASPTRSKRGMMACTPERQQRRHVGESSRVAESYATEGPSSPARDCPASTPMAPEEMEYVHDPARRHDNAFLKRLQQMRDRHRMNMELLETEGYSRPSTGAPEQEPGGVSEDAATAQLADLSSPECEQQSRDVARTEASEGDALRLNNNAEYISGESEDESAGRSRYIKASDIAGKLAMEHGYDIIQELYGSKERGQDAPASGASSSRESQKQKGRTDAFLMDDYFKVLAHTHYPRGRKPNSEVIPKPFSFERREAVKQKSIARRKFEEDMMQRMIEEENLINYTFKAKPIPTSTYLHLHEANRQEEEARRLESRKRAIEKAQRRSQTPQPRHHQTTDRLAQPKTKTGAKAGDIMADWQQRTLFKTQRGRPPSTKSQSQSHPLLQQSRSGRSSLEPHSAKLEVDPEEAPAQRSSAPDLGVSQDNAATPASVKESATSAPGTPKAVDEDAHSRAASSNGEAKTEEYTPPSSQSATPSRLSMHSSLSDASGTAIGTKDAPTTACASSSADQSKGAACTRSSSTPAPPRGGPPALSTKPKRPPAPVPEYPFKPKINPRIPDWQYEWARTSQQLARLRASKEPTEPEEFRFQAKLTSKEEIAQKALADMAEDEKRLTEMRWPYKMRRSEPKIQPPAKGTRSRSLQRGTTRETKTTLASKLRSLENLRNIIKKEQMEANRQKEETDRKKKRREIAERVCPNLLPNPTEERRLTEGQRRAQYRKEHRQQMADYKKSLEETYRRIEQTRPFLFERGEVEKKKQEARDGVQRSFMEVLKQQGLPIDQISKIMAEDLAGSVAAVDDDDIDEVDGHDATAPTAGASQSFGASVSLGLSTSASEKSGHQDKSSEHAEAETMSSASESSNCGRADVGAKTDDADYNDEEFENPEKAADDDTASEKSEKSHRSSRSSRSRKSSTSSSSTRSRASSKDSD